MARFAEIGSGLTLGSGQSVRRNAGNTAFEVFTPIDPAGASMTGAIVPADHGTATSPQVVAVVYGEGSAPTASTTPEGTLYVKYTA